MTQIHSATPALLPQTQTRETATPLLGPAQPAPALSETEASAVPLQASFEAPSDSAEACCQRPAADFEAQDESCCFPDATAEAATAPAAASNAPPPGSSLKDRMAARQEFGQKLPDTGDHLFDRSEALAAAGAEGQRAAVSEAAQAAGLSAETTAAAEALLASLPPEKQAEAATYLEHLLTERGQDLGDERTGALLARLQGMNGQDYDPRMGSSADVVVSALHDIAAPLNIDQGYNTGTCSATAMQMALAQSQPERYLDMVDSLAQDQNFEAFAPDWSFAEEGQYETNENGSRSIVTGETGRSPTAQLVQNAIMEYANGDEDYTSAVDGIQNRPAGNDEAWLADTLDAVMNNGEEHVMLHIDNGEYPESEQNRNMPASEIMQAIADYQPSPDRPLVMAYSDPGHGLPGNPLGHAALIIGTEGDDVLYVDPIGGVTKRISAAELQEQIWSIQVPRSAL